MSGIRKELMLFKKEPFVQDAKRFFGADAYFDGMVYPEIYTTLHVALTEFQGNLRGQKILQLACNWAPYLFYLKNICGARTYGADLNMAAVDYAVSFGKLQVRFSDVSALPFENNFFDAVISSHFLEWFYIANLTGRQAASPYTANVLKEVSRVLKQKGNFYSHRENIDSETLSGANFPAWTQVTFPDDRSEVYGNVDVLTK